jgi:hypothetical protein
MSAEMNPVGTRTQSTPLDLTLVMIKPIKPERISGTNDHPIIPSFVAEVNRTA